MTIPANTPPGTRVRFKTWEQLAREFGASGRYMTCGGVAFTPNMRPLCGQTHAVHHIERGRHVFLADHADPWNYTLEMFDLPADPKNVARMLKLKRDSQLSSQYANQTQRQ